MSARHSRLIPWSGLLRITIKRWRWRWRQRRSNRKMWIFSMSISNDPIWTAMAGLVAMKLWLSSRAPVSPNRSLLRYAHADQRETGLLGRAEFYNALRLDSVAQSERELTLEMLKAALYGPAAAKIPAPKINLAATPNPQFNSVTTAPATQGGVVTPTSSQNLGFRGPQVPPQYSSFGEAPATRGGAVTPTSSQNLGFKDHKYNLSVILLQQLLRVVLLLQHPPRILGSGYYLQV